MKWINILRYFYLLGAANALFFSILIFSKPKRKFADKILGYWLIILTLQLIFPFLYLADLNGYYQFAGLEVSFYAIHPLLLYLYIKSTIGQLPAKRKLTFLVLFAIAIEIFVMTYFFIPAEDRLNLILGKEPVNMLYYILFIPFIFYFLYFFILSINTLKDYKSNILHVYSYRENIDLMWLRKLVLFFYGLLILILPLVIVFYFNRIPIAEGDYFYFAGLTVFIFFLGYWGYRQGEVFNFQPVIEDNKGNSNSNSNIERYQANIQNIFNGKAMELKGLMENKKPYLNPSLTIYELARLIDMQPYQLSKLINKEFNCNFFEFINKYRIESFKEDLISDKYKEFTLLGVALECGFNSKSSFNRIFKEQTGITPGEFKKNITQPTS
jgi:AraC-like DNA-binding protein